jgi:DNA mismatch repair ATPase MutS
MSPSWLLLFLPAVAVAVIAALLVRVARRDRRALEKLAAGWGRPQGKRRDMERIGLYARLAGSDGPGAVDDRTWRDLDMDAVFAQVDRTSSVVGQQLLSARLRAPPRDPAERAAFEALVQRFGADRALRERAQMALSPLADLSSSALPLLFFGEETPLPWRRLPPLLTAATIACLGLTLVHPGFLLAVLACFGLNLATRFRLWRRMSSFLEPARELEALLSAGRRLAALELSADRTVTEGIAGTLGRLGRMPRAVSWLATDRTSGNELAAVVLEYLNVFLLLDVNAFVLTQGFLRRSSGEVRELYEAIGRIDVALSVASLRAGAPSFGLPEIDGAGPFALEELVHPLVAGAVPSALRLDERGLFITGSNMSGKSTFLKAVGVNVILAQALGTAFAERYRAPFLTVRTLMIGADSITRGESYYLAEVRAAHERLQAIGEDGAHLVLVDELFRGTSTEERIGAGKAYLEALVRGGARTLAASHDRELGGLLASTFDSKHFTERVEGQEIVFDYTLRDGACPTRNALRILEIAGFSSEVVGEARRVARLLSGERGA